MAAPTGSAAVDAELTAKLEEQSIQQEYKKVRVSTFLSCECLCSICVYGDLATSFDLHLPLFNCLCKSHVLMHVSIISHSLHKS